MSALVQIRINIPYNRPVGATGGRPHAQTTATIQFIRIPRVDTGVSPYMPLPTHPERVQGTQAELGYQQKEYPSTENPVGAGPCACPGSNHPDISYKNGNLPRPTKTPWFKFG
ncbi:MAG: hypothetical protein D3923_10690 [Candidatus Electrothrix sp. AR3]|nr:hypothetical protein [Candidatus Electrothrix sp. AR3]